MVFGLGQSSSEWAKIYDVPCDSKSECIRWIMIFAVDTGTFGKLRQSVKGVREIVDIFSWPCIYQSLSFSELIVQIRRL